MDYEWFKSQQRRTGVTQEDLAEKIGRDRSVISRIYNGHQLMTNAQAEIFAEAMGVPVEEVMQRAGLLAPTTAKKLKRGFSESDAVPYDFAGASSRAVKTVAEALGSRAGVDTWEVSGSSMILGGYMPGDRILVDTHAADRCGAGDIVIAQIYDWQTGAAKTIMRRYEPPVLIADTTTPSDKRIHVVDGNNIIIKGKVIASWREP